MKKTLFATILLLLLLSACGKEEVQKVKINFEIPGWYRASDGHLKYLATIGHDFDSALDSLKKIRPVYNNHFLIFESTRVDYPTDDRSFYEIFYTDDTTGVILDVRGYSDVLDTKGDWYTLYPLPD